MRRTITLPCGHEYTLPHHGYVDKSRAYCSICAERKEAKILFNAEENILYTEGNTFSQKNYLKACGFSFHGDTKSWYKTALQKEADSMRKSFEKIGLRVRY